MAWDLDEGRLISFDLIIKEISRAADELILIPQKYSADWRHLNDFIRGSGMMNFFIPQQNLLFRSELVALEGDYLVIKKPKKYSIEERRSSERYIALNSVKLEIVKNDRIKAYKVFDLSETGLSIIVSTSDSSHFKIGEVLDKACLKLKDKKTRVALELCNERTILPYQFETIPYRGKRYGFKFVGKLNMIGEFLQEISNED